MNKFFVALIIIFMLNLVFLALGKDEHKWLIVNGISAKSGEIPAIVSVQNDDSIHMCGATIISLWHIITAAHCVRIPDVNGDFVEMEPDYIKLVAGDLKIGNDESESRQILYAEEIFIHPDFVPSAVDNDIAIIRLSDKIIESPNIKRIKIATSTPNVKQKCVVAGWGLTSEHDIQFPDILQKVNVEIKARSSCNSSHSYDGKIPANVVCAGAIGYRRNDDNVEDSCQGDSGGPLICNNQLTGIISFGFGCGNAEFPGVHTDVSKFYQWIVATMKIEPKIKIRSMSGCSKLNIQLVMMISTALLNVCNVL